MRTTRLGDTGMTSSVLGFGCAAILGRTGRAQSLRALAEAFDRGVTFYDTARSYGYGESEGLLGEFLAGRRGQVILSTKFGILPAPQNRFKNALKPAARRLLQMLPGARVAVRRQIGAQFARDQFTVEVLRSSLETSLRKLRTDYIDLLFLHSPPAGVIAETELFRELERVIAAGKVRMAGISSSREVIAAVRGSAPAVVQAYQMPANIFALPAADVVSGDAVLVANHPFGGSEGAARTRAVLCELSADPALDAGIREKLAASGAPDAAAIADVVLNLIVHSEPSTRTPGNPESGNSGIDVVIPAMMSSGHIRANCDALTQSRFTTGELASIRNLLAARAGTAVPGIALG